MNPASLLADRIVFVPPRVIVISELVQLRDVARRCDLARTYTWRFAGDKRLVCDVRFLRRHNLSLNRVRAACDYGDAEEKINCPHAADFNRAHPMRKLKQAREIIPRQSRRRSSLDSQRRS